MNRKRLNQIKRILTLSLVTAIIAGRILMPGAVAHAQAGESTTFTFSLCPDQSGEGDIGANQITMVVTQVNDGEFEIAFNNVGAIDSSITDIYLHDPFGLVVDDEVELESFGEVNFEESDSLLIDDVTCPNASPSGVPNAVGFVAVDDGAGADEVSAAAVSARHHNGVNPQEWLKAKFKTNPNITYEQILSALLDGRLVVGVKLLVALISFIVAYLKANPHHPGTYIELASFDAEPVADGVAVRWETGVEVDNAGFNVYRGNSISGPFTKVNSVLIAATGNGGGASYELIDPDGTSASFYQLEDLDFNGTSTKHLPTQSKAAQFTFDNFLFVPMVSN